jgi:hypothetical protein
MVGEELGAPMACFYLQLGRAGFEPRSGCGIYSKILAKPPFLRG